MDSSEKDWLKNPTKNQLAYIIILWFISVEFIVASITDKFTKSFFQKDQFMMYFLIFSSTLVTVYAIINYFKNKKKNTQS